MRIIIGHPINDFVKIFCFNINFGDNFFFVFNDKRRYLLSWVFVIFHKPWYIYLRCFLFITQILSTHSVFLFIPLVLFVSVCVFECGFYVARIGLRLFFSKKKKKKHLGVLDLVVIHHDWHSMCAHQRQSLLIPCQQINVCQLVVIVLNKLIIYNSISRQTHSLNPIKWFHSNGKIIEMTQSMWNKSKIHWNQCDYKWNGPLGDPKANPIKIDAVMNPNQHSFLYFKCHVQLSITWPTLKWHRYETIFCCCSGVTFNRKALYSWKSFTSDIWIHFRVNWQTLRFFFASLNTLTFSFCDWLSGKKKHFGTWVFST